MLGEGKYAVDVDLLHRSRTAPFVLDTGKGETDRETVSLVRNPQQRSGIESRQPSRAQLAHQDGFDAMHAVDAGDFSTGHDNHLSRHRQAAPIAATAARTARVSRCSRVRVSLPGCPSDAGSAI